MTFLDWRKLVCTAVVIMTAACADARDEAAPSASDPPESSAPAAGDNASTSICDVAPPTTDRTICAPARVGPLVPATTRAQLDSLFGSDQLRDQPVDVGEGMTEPGTLVNVGRADSARVVWTDSSRTAVAMVLALGPAWRTPDGLGVGSALEDIVRVLGTVEVMGFGWDYGGTILLTRTRLENSGLFFRTEPRSEAMHGSDAYGRVRGDNAFAATDPDVRALDLVVHRVDVVWRR